jgi:hypothetical protein
LLLHPIYIGAPAAVEFLLVEVEQAAMQSLDQRQGFKIKRTDVVETLFAFGWLRRLGYGFHM